MTAPGADVRTKGAERDITALAKGGRTNVVGFLLRLVARVPFLFIASRLYGAAAMGRFAAALVIVEFAGMLATLGQKRGLAQVLADESVPPANAVADALLVATVIAVAFTIPIALFPQSMFPERDFVPLERWLAAAVWLLAVGDIALAALAFRFDVASTVRARSVIEPWTLSIAAGAYWFVWRPHFGDSTGLTLAYVASCVAATGWALFALLRAFGLPRAWRPHPARLLRLVGRNLPLAGADAVEWGTRKLDVFILRFFVGEAPLGIYYFAQQFASLPQKLKTSFEPVLGPVITRNVREGNMGAIARQVCQVGFWITAAQAGIALALAIPGHGLMGLGGPGFVVGTPALIFLLLAEVFAAPAVVSEAALVYIAPLRNLWISLATVAVQAGLTLAGMDFVRRVGLDDFDRISAAAAALMVALVLASLAKAWLLSVRVRQRIISFRWSLLGAGVPAAVVGVAAVRLLPEWAGIAVGVPAILGLYCWVMWARGFGPDDRMLFRKAG